MLSRWSDFGRPLAFDFDRTFSPLLELRREMDRLFADFELGFGSSPLRAFAGLRPEASLWDEGDALVARFEVPGVSEKDLDVSITGSSVMVRGERKDDTPPGFTAYRKERGAVSFSRAITLPCKVDPDRAEATLKDGILTLKMPKAKEAQPRQITVQAKS